MTEDRMRAYERGLRRTAILQVAGMAEALAGAVDEMTDDQWGAVEEGMSAWQNALYDLDGTVGTKMILSGAEGLAEMAQVVCEYRECISDEDMAAIVESCKQLQQTMAEKLGVA